MARRMMMMLLVAVSLLAGVATATRAVANPYDVRGKVYCDTCRAGFETSASKYLSGAKVVLECRHRRTQKVLFSAEAITDETGSYKIVVQKDQKDAVCDTILVSSPDEGCAIADPGRDRSRIVLTSFNGMMSTTRYANNMGFTVKKPMAYCGELLKQYELDEDDV